MSSDSIRRWLLLSAVLSVATYVTASGVSGTLFHPPLAVLDLTVPADPAGRVRAALGLILVVSFPGLLLALCIPWRTEKTITDLTLESLGYSAAAHVLNLSILKGIGMAPSAGALIVCGGLEVFAAWLFCRSLPLPVSVRPPTRGEWTAVALSALLVVFLAGTNVPFVMRGLGDYFYEEGLPEDIETAAKEAGGVTVERSSRWEQVRAFEYALMRITGMSGPESLVLRAPGYRETTLRFLWQGPVGSSLVVDCEDVHGVARVERSPAEMEEEGPVLRYLDNGIDGVALRVPVRSSRRCVLRPVLETGQSGTVVDLTGCPAEVLYATASLGGWTPTHYYQILNIAENVAWGRELLEDRWTTRNQPPLWSYVYSSVDVYVGKGLWAINLFFFLVVGLSVFLAWAVVLLERPDTHPLLMIPLLLTGVSHAHIMIEPGSTNFPDNLYALAMLACLYALVQGRRRAMFAAAGVATTLLRYSGSGLVLLMSGFAAWLWKARRRRMLENLAGWAIGMGAVALAFLVAALATGTAREWVDVLYFETFPEHFHGNYDIVEMLGRPPEFYWTLLKVTGFMPVLWLFLKGKTAQLAATLTIGYTALLCLIDHFPSHYFVPPMYLVAVATTASLAALHGWRRWVPLVACLGGLAWGIQQPL